METISVTANYWLVNHPTINNFEWKRGITLGASPLFVALTLVSYIFFTSLLYNRNRSYFRTLSLPLHRFATVYNLLIFTLSLLMSLGCGLSILSQMPNPHWIFCFPANRTPTRGPVFFWGYIFYLSKILEFTDTLLILLSNTTNRRLSFLHVFHHSMVLIMSFIWVDSPQSTFPLGVVINAGVHTVMYSYYLMCSLGIRIRPSWKRMVTNLQITQFIVAFFVAGLTLYYHLVKYRCSGSIYAWSFGFVFNVSLLYLFLDFYFTSYKNNNKYQQQVFTKEDHKKTF